MSIRVATCNLWVGNRNPGRALVALGSHGVQVVGLQEAPDHLPALNRVDGWRAVAHGIERGVRSNALAVREDVHLIQSYSVQVAAAIPGDKLAPARGVLLAWVEVGGERWPILTTHLNAGVQRTKGRWIGRFLRARRWKAHMRWIRRQILALPPVEQRRLIILGDFNALRDVPGRWQLERFFGALGYQVIRQGVDVIIVHRVRRVSDVARVPKALTGSDDHDALVATIS